MKVLAILGALLFSLPAFGQRAVQVLANPTNLSVVSPSGFWTANAAQIAAAIGSGGGTNGVIDIRARGAIVDDGLDDTAAVQDAINEAITRRWTTVFFPPGVTIVSNIVVTNNLFVGGISFQGPPGLAATIRASRASTMFDIRDVRQLSIENLAFDGNNLSTNVIKIDNATQVNIRGCYFVNVPGDPVLMDGVQNYGHDISGNLFSNFRGEGIGFRGVSATKMVIRENVFDAYTNVFTAVGTVLRNGAANITVRDNTYQSLLLGVDNRGSPSGANLKNTISDNYFELCTLASIRLAADGQITGTSINDNFFNVSWTSNQVAVIDGGIPAQIFGMVFGGNVVTPDLGKVMVLTNAVGAGWRIQSAGTDWATDYVWNQDFPAVFDFGNQHGVSVLVTNFSPAVSGTTNMQLVMFRVPDFLVVNPDANAAVTIAGTLPHGSSLMIRNTSTNGLVFAGTPILQNRDERFFYLNGVWSRAVGPYLLNSGGTVAGPLTVSSNFTVQGSASMANLTLSGAIQNNHGFISSGGIGGTNGIAIGANSNSVVGILKNGFYYVIFGTNNLTSFKTAVELVAPTNTVAFVAGFPTRPDGAATPLVSIAVPDLAAAIGLNTNGGSVRVNGSSVVTNFGQSATSRITVTNQTAFVEFGPLTDLAASSSIAAPEIRGTGTNAGAIWLADASGTNWVSLAPPTAILTGAVWRLPDAPRSGVVLSTASGTNVQLSVIQHPGISGLALMSTNSGQFTFAPGGGGGASPTVTQGDLIARGASFDERVPIGEAGLALVSDGTMPRWGDLTFWRIGPEDLLVGALPASDMAGISGNGGSAFAAGVNGEVNHPGIAVAQAGANTNGFGGGMGRQGAIVGGPGVGPMYGEMILKLPDTLSDSTNRYQVLAGFFDQNSTTPNADGIYSIIDGTTNAWQFLTQTNTVAATTNAVNVPVVASGWYRLGWSIATNGSSAVFSVDGVRVATNTVNIPAGTARAYSFGALIIKIGGSVGTANRLLSLDAYVAGGVR